MSNFFNSFIIFSTILLMPFVVKAQIFRGEVAIYDKGIYNLYEPEGWERIKLNGGLILDHKGFISFKENHVVFIAVSKESNEEIEMSLSYNHKKKGMSLMSDFFPYVPSFITEDIQNSNQVVIDYFSMESFNDDRGLFVLFLNNDNKMIFLETNSDVLADVRKIYD